MTTSPRIGKFWLFAVTSSLQIIFFDKPVIRQARDMEALLITIRNTYMTYTDPHFHNPSTDRKHCFRLYKLFILHMPLQIHLVFTIKAFVCNSHQVMREFFESSPSRNAPSSSEPTITADFEVMRQRLLDYLDSFTRFTFKNYYVTVIQYRPNVSYHPRARRESRRATRFA